MSDENDQKPGPSKQRIFISYSSRDADAAHSLARLCLRTGAETWADRDLRSGVDWCEKIDEAIGRSNVFLVLVSNAKQLDSPWQSREWSAICERKWTRPDIQVIPILLDDVETPAFLRGLEALDGSNKTKLARCVDHIADYPSVRAVTKSRSLSDEQRAEVQKRFRELLEALSKPAGDVPPAGTQS